MKRSAQFRLIGILVIICISLSCVIFVRQCFRTAKDMAALTDAAEQTQGNQQCIFLLHDQIIRLDDLIAELTEYPGVREAEQTGLQNELSQLAETGGEISRRFRGFSSVEAVDSALSSMVQSGDMILPYAQSGSAVPLDTVQTYLDSSAQCLYALAELEAQFSQSTILNFEIINGSFRDGKIHLITSALFFLLVLLVSAFIFFRVRRRLFPGGRDKTREGRSG